MAKEREIELAELVKILVALFPSQHPKCASWLQAIRPRAPVVARPGQPVNRPAKPGNVPGSRTPVSPRPSEPAPPPPREESPAPPAKPLRKPPVPPAFAKELTATVAEWRDRHPGIEISWDKETERRDTVAAKAGLADWKEGWNATIPSLMADVDLGSQSVSVEVVIPRTVDFQSVLIGAGHKGMPKRFFEISVDELTIARIRELGTYVLATGARQ